MGDRLDAKDQLFDAFASVAKALGNGRRAEIVDVLAQGERSVDELAAEIGQSVANTSQHLQVLARPGSCEPPRRARASTTARPATASSSSGRRVRDVAAEHVANVDVLADAYLGDREQVEQVTVEELAARLADGEVVVLDVRAAAGVRRRPHARRAARRRSTSCPRCVDEPAARRRGRGLLPRAVLRLRRRRRAAAAARGAAARRLDVGFPEWRRAGLPVATSRLRGEHR